MPLALFYSYSHQDEPLRDELDTHLALLRRRGVISAWHERRVAPEEAWRDAIDAHVDRADLILLLVSPDFIASDYCHDVEMKRAIARHGAGTATVVPVIAQPVNLDGSPLAALPALPLEALAVTSWPSRDQAWTDVAKGVRRLAESLARSPAAPSLPLPSAIVRRAIEDSRAIGAAAPPAPLHPAGPDAASPIAPLAIAVSSAERRADIALERALAGFQEEMVEAMRARAPGEALRPAASWRLGERLAGIADWKCILWVDDEPANSRFETAALRRLQIEVVTATSTEAALALLVGAAGTRFDLIVSDWKRPGPDPDVPEGLRLLRALRKHDGSTPCVVYDAVTSVHELAQRQDLVRAAGGQGAFARPDALFDRIATLLGV